MNSLESKQVQIHKSQSNVSECIQSSVADTDGHHQQVTEDCGIEYQWFGNPDSGTDV